MLDVSPPIPAVAARRRSETWRFGDEDVLFRKATSDAEVEDAAAELERRTYPGIAAVPPAAAWDSAGAPEDAGKPVGDGLVPGALVDVALRLGNFGAFGYCWLLHRAKTPDTRRSDVTQ